MSIIVPRPWHGEPAGSTVVFGTLPGQHPQVVQAAAVLTARMGASLVCVWADGEHVAAERPDGTWVATPLDPDAVDDPSRPTGEELMAARLEEVLAGSPAPWRLHYTTGAPARALHKVAEELDALAIAVGTREPGFGHWVAEKVTGSVAARLASHQHRPVILLPHPGSGPVPGEHP
ncbi:universal stress protein [Arthrobacter mobilis]|uniref:Universal stress protein n=1 Tax=Arthrobacter mobilis TaxID=2724944 RepID=A0A7X6HEH0_9MICC|nr:universal stress protein [Arthrobacter mobilis]NKX55654.1 universal stress protein [Arthrobacter mobilis]